MGYREDGFFNIGWTQDARDAKPSAGGKQNAPFLFPDKSIRFLDAQAELQRKFNTVTDTISRGDYQIHRGYIRNLEQPHFGNVPISKCNFQFNPQEIRQSVSMREDLYLPLLQDVAQLSQPIGAVVNFTFDLLFDRSQELSKGARTTVAANGTTITNIEENVDPLNPNPEKDPYDIGVLADLRILYSVIGQGFSREMLNFQKKTLIAGAERTSANQSTEGSTADGASPEGTATSSAGTEVSALGEIDDAALDAIFEVNYGNWGLLMPNPVRVMFSSLFMLDGFITGTNVDFLKFSTKMVPVMCRVTMNMSAMYIGFARTDTFLTKQFKDAAAAIEEERQENEAIKNEILKALLTTGAIFAISTAWTSISTEDGWDRSIRNADSPLPVWTLVVNDEAGKQGGGAERAIFLGFPNVSPKEGGYDETLADGTVVRRGADEDNILKLYQETLSFTISYTWDISIYGGITSGTALTASSAQSAVNAKSYSTSSTIKLVGKYSGTESSSSENEWGKGTSGDGNAAERVRRRSIRGNDEANNEAISNFAIHDFVSQASVPDWLKNAYYIVDISATISVSYGSNSNELSISKYYTKVLSGNQNINQKMILNWSSGNGGDDTPIVRTGNLLDPEAL